MDPLKRRGSWPRQNLSPLKYCSYHHSYSHDIEDYQDFTCHPRRASPRDDRTKDSPQTNSPYLGMTSSIGVRRPFPFSGMNLPVEGMSKMRKGLEKGIYNIGVIKLKKRLQSRKWIPYLGPLRRQKNTKFTKKL